MHLFFYYPHSLYNVGGDAVLNYTLLRARKIKNDEYYTLRSDIETELVNYQDHFKDKVIYCNCDTPDSEFVKYFMFNFKRLAIKELLCSCWNGEDDNRKSLFSSSNKRSYYYSFDGTSDGLIQHSLNGCGSYDSKDCLELLHRADIVVTNPPFTKLTDFISMLIKHEKKFIIVGPKICPGYKELFSFFKDNKIWTGNRSMNSDMWFKVPSATQYERIVDGVPCKRVMACWFTNLDIPKRHAMYDFTHKYTESDYPKYTNYDAIEVSSIFEIPDDYYGVMGVPITFFDVYDPEQFEVIDINPHFIYTSLASGTQLKLHDKSDPYVRILVRRRK